MLIVRPVPGSQKLKLSVNRSRMLHNNDFLYWYILASSEVAANTAFPSCLSCKEVTAGKVDKVTKLPDG